MIADKNRLFKLAYTLPQDRSRVIKRMKDKHKINDEATRLKNEILDYVADLPYADEERKKFISKRIALLQEKYHILRNKYVDVQTT